LFEAIISVHLVRAPIAYLELSARRMCDEKTLRDIFKVFDKDGSGKIDMGELVEVMKAYFDAIGEPADNKKCRETAEVIMKEIDSGGDGTINIEEFITAFK